MRATRLLRGITTVLASVLVIGLTAWAAGAIYYSHIPWPGVRTAVALAFVVATALAFLLLRPRLRTLVGFFVVFGFVLVWWFTIPASNQRDWQPDVAVT